jgi:hypothetical protein
MGQPQVAARAEVITSEFAVQEFGRWSAINERRRCWLRGDGSLAATGQERSFLAGTPPMEDYPQVLMLKLRDISSLRI